MGNPHLVVAADSGAELALSAGMKVDLLIGDLDSISPASLTRLQEQGTVMENHPPDKDSTDLALALSAMLHRDMESVTVIGGGGGRLDHLLGNVATICDPALSGIAVRWITARESAFPVHNRLTFTAQPGTQVSVLAVGGIASGVTLSGLRWPLHSAPLHPHDSQGVSNQALGGPITVQVTTGTLLVVINE